MAEDEEFVLLLALAEEAGEGVPDRSDGHRLPSEVPKDLFACGEEQDGGLHFLDPILIVDRLIMVHVVDVKSCTC